MAKKCSIPPELSTSLKSILDFVKDKEIIEKIKLGNEEFTIDEIRGMVNECGMTEEPKMKTKKNRYNEFAGICMRGGQKSMSQCACLYHKEYNPETYAERVKEGRCE